ncbi:multiheme c-type cytochrome [Tenacibaculum caenipelagi]|uniref:Cytochrome c7-like protein n=1 Tax=Tenacibaculum caenipelagi TaxID=1325435 RepID=A0A4V3D2X9_9FLAO|nr:multiheme c-type cytochrome [Tenacibaculum caenipelagi]TDQ25390.1 cytochrome c7-like protein [Tenacibaculum caenipelagi]
MRNHKYIKFVFCTILFVIISVSCKHKEDEYHSITDKIEAESINYKGTSISSEKYLEGMKMMEVTENEITFLIPTRKDKIKSYKCTECHTQPLVKMQAKDIKKAHWNIKLNHATLNTMNCITCHNDANMDDLKSITGHSIDLNKSYKLCSQCHQKQYKDWTGGAHGKRIESWATPRASMTCVNCHNPHSPSFSPKWPARFNTQKVKERK